MDAKPSDNVLQKTYTEERTYEALPEEAKAMCHCFINTIPGFTLKQYLDQYDWS